MQKGLVPFLLLWFFIGVSVTFTISDIYFVDPVYAEVGLDATGDYWICEEVGTGYYSGWLLVHPWLLVVFLAFVSGCDVFWFKKSC